MHLADFITTDPGVALAMFGQLAGLLIWGAMLTQRVRVLEREIAALKGLDVRVARIEERLENLLEQFKELNSNLRWMQKPAEYTSLNPRQPG